MIRTSPRAISLEKHKKKDPYEGRTRQSDRAGKTRTALLEMRRPRQKQCEIILLLKSVSLKMSESEHSDSEFYYPGELSDAEMLQLPTHSEATERKSLLSKRSNAAARGLVPPKNENEKKKNWSYDKILLTE